ASQSASQSAPQSASQWEPQSARRSARQSAPALAPQRAGADNTTPRRSFECAFALLSWLFAGYLLAIPLLFPLDGGGWFGADIVHHAIHAAYFINDAIAHRRQRIKGNACPVGGHEVAALDGADGDDRIVRARIAHHSDGSDRQQHREHL